MKKMEWKFRFRKFAALGLSFLLAASLCLTGCGEDVEETFATNGNADASYDQAVDADSFTLMVYICGSDLESENGCATADLNEMMYADSGKNLNIVVQTGGAKSWENSVISSKTVQRFHLSSDGLDLLGDVGRKQITDANTLSDFIRFAKDSYPADRYGLIFWDHGGGTMGGYGADENYDDASMDIAQLAKGIKNGGCYFDFIGFDCCLMATMENASALCPYANYMIASEETEPGTGWYYTNFISQIEHDPSASVKSIANTILQDYTNEDNTYLGSGLTLSLIDLNQMGIVLDALYTYLGNARNVLKEGGFSEISNARSDARAYGDEDFDQVDMIDLIDQYEIEGGKELKEAVLNAIVLNSSNLLGSHGLAMYYPYDYAEYYGDISSMAQSVGLDGDSYTAFFDDFVSVKEGGLYYGGGNSNPYSGSGHSSSGYDSGYDSGDEDEWDYGDSSWFNDELASEYEDSYSYVDSDELEITEKGDGYVLQLSEEDWEIITSVELQVYVDDGEGYLYLGSDDAVEFDDDGDLVVDFDYTWIHLNDYLVPYSTMENGEYTDGSFYSMGAIPAVLNGETEIQIWVLWQEDEDPVVLGYTTSCGAHVSSRGYKNFRDGDVIDFLFEYYDYNGDYEDSYSLEDNTLVYDSREDFEISYQDIGEADTEICFMLTDIYGNEYWTEPLSISY